jgi:hypothetical protein
MVSFYNTVGLINLANPTTYMLKSKSECYYRNFKETTKSKETFVTYDHRLKAYIKYRNFTEYSQLIEGKDVKQIEDEIADFIIFLKKGNIL